MYLVELRNDVEIIDYRCPSVENAYRIFPKFRKNIFILLHQYFDAIKHYSGLKKRKIKFQAFIADFKLTRPMDLNEIGNSYFNYDLIIAGSDQIRKVILVMLLGFLMRIQRLMYYLYWFIIEDEYNQNNFTILNSPLE